MLKSSSVQVAIGFGDGALSNAEQGVMRGSQTGIVGQTIGIVQTGKPLGKWVIASGLTVAALLFGMEAARSEESLTLASSPSMQLSSLRIANKADDRAAEDFLMKGTGKYLQQDYKGAIADYDQAIKLKPDYADAYNNRGVARRDLGDNKGAIADYDQAIKLKPDYAFAYSNRGIARRALGDNKGAIADYDQAIKLKPDYAFAYNNRGNARRALGDNKGAIADYQKAADLYKQQGKTKDYEDALNQIKRLQ
jgi:tetratricopeptide (TPR) repeat protein